MSEKEDDRSQQIRIVKGHIDTVNAYLDNALKIIQNLQEDYTAIKLCQTDISWVKLNVECAKNYLQDLRSRKD